MKKDGKAQGERSFMRKQIIAIMTAAALCSMPMTVMAEASGKNSADPEEWETVASLDITDEQILEIYDLYEKAWETAPEDPVAEWSMRKMYQRK